MAIDIDKRTFSFSLKIIQIVNKLPQTVVGTAIARQIIRSATSIGANTEEALGGYTRADFFHSLNIAKKEARETKYWLKIIIESKLLDTPEVRDLLQECDEIIAILTSIIKKHK